MTEHPSAELTKDELFQAFKSIELAHAAKLKERGELPYLFNHCKSVLREFKAQYPSAMPDIINALQLDFLGRHR